MTTVTITAPLAVREPRAAAWMGQLSARIAHWVRATTAQAPLMVHGVNPHAAAPLPSRVSLVEVL